MPKKRDFDQNLARVVVFPVPVLHIFLSVIDSAGISIKPCHRVNGVVVVMASSIVVKKPCSLSYLLTSGHFCTLESQNMCIGNDDTRVL